MKFDEPRSLLVADLARYTQAVIETKQSLNRLTYIGQLPPETLSEIFLFHAFSVFDASTTLHNPSSSRGPGKSNLQEVPKPYEWASVTHVCHYWRVVALDLAPFWNRIWLTNLSYLEQLLVRSKDFPLTIRAERGILPVDMLEAVFTNLGRIRTLYINTRWLPQPFEANRLMLKNFGSVAPVLETLFLKLLQGTYLLSGDFNMESLFVGCELPSLRRLELISYDKSWKSVLFKPTLTHLKLSSADRYSLPQIPQVLSALAELPLLEELDLTTVFPGYPEDYDFEEDPLSSLEPVLLPRLRKVRLVHSLLPCSLLLRCISAPEIMSIVIDCDVESRVDTMWYETEELSKALYAHIGDSHPDSRRSCHIHHDRIEKCHVVRLRTWREHYPVIQLSDVSLHGDLPEPLLDIRIDWRVAANIWPSSLDSLLFVMRGASTVLDVSTQERTDYYDFGSLGHHLDMEEFGVAGPAGTWICDWLTSKMDGYTMEDVSEGRVKSSTPPLYFQGLSVLLLRNIDVQPISSRLPASLRKRNRANLRLVQLVIRDYVNLSQDVIDTLERLVGSQGVDWDEKPGHDAMDDC